MVALDVLDRESAKNLAELFRAFSDPSRLRIISVLASKELNVNALADMVGLSKSATSHQLRGLRQMRLVATKKVGRQVFYRLDDEHIKDLYLQGLDHITHE
ncbi:MAG: helix-turn-helix transcriptional regulator [Chloroflexi bacterium]|nr:helix-turn-helix transcriptional regulator [Chloroflexota bacterium]